MATEQDVIEAVNLLWTETPERGNAFEPIRSGFKEGIVTPHLARSVTEALLRVAMYDFFTQGVWRASAHTTLKMAAAPDQDGDLVAAVTETLIAIPKPNSLIDYNEATLVLILLLQADEVHPALLRTIQTGVATAHNEITDICVIRSINGYLALGQSSIVSKEVYSILMTMLDNGSDYACSEGIKALISIVDKSSTIPIEISDLNFLWNRAKNDMLAENRPHVDDIARNSAKLISSLVVKSKIPLIGLPSPLNELPPELSDRYVSYIRTELTEREYQAANEFPWGSLERLFARNQVGKKVQAYLGNL